MRIRAFHASDGDCVLVSTTTTHSGDAATENHLLIDGGRAGSYRQNVRDTISQLDQIDIVCVSHIDDDHIAGVVAMIDDVVAWRIHDYRLRKQLATTQPSFPRPPDLGEIWHNSLFDLLGEDLEPIVQPAMTTAAGIFASSQDPAVARLGYRFDNLATGERSAMELSRRISRRQLNIQRNRPADQLMRRRSPRSYRRVGPMTIRILGPSEEAVADLRDAWRKWIEEHDEALIKLQREMLQDEERLGTLASAVVAQPLVRASLGEGVSGVSAPNVASLTLLITEKGGPTVLMTGDATSPELLDGLRHYKKLDNGRIHVDLLKVQHHGAKANVDRDFVGSVTATNYLFCGNGASGNPEPEVVSAFAEARLTGLGGGPPLRPGEEFKFWFTSSRSTKGIGADRQSHMGGIEELVRNIKGDLDGDDLFSFEFLDNGHLTIDL